MQDTNRERQVTAVEAVAHLYHSWLTGLVLMLVARKDAATAEEFVFRLFRAQHLEKFLPGLTKLGLDREPHAVAAAKYHYFSNQLGGVKVEYWAESATKAWIRYPPPRWIWQGTAICGIPSNVNRAMLRGWHAHNGVTLGNPRLGFVCTKTTVDGQPGLEGYYLEYDRDLAPEECLVFRPDLDCPAIDVDSLPKLDVDDWPEERRAKAYRNYSMAYIKTALPVLIELLGADEALRIGRLCGLQIGMHCYDEIASMLAHEGSDAISFAALLQALWVASGDQIVRDEATLERTGWRLFGDDATHPAIRAIWTAPFEGMLAVHNRFLQLGVDGEQFKIT